MELSDCFPMDELFTHIADDGRVLHFNASAMARAVPPLLLEGAIEHIQVAMEKDFVGFILQRRGVEQAKLARMREPYLSVPVIGVEMVDGSVLTVDGHHRIVLLDRNGAESYGMYLFPLGVWRTFLVDMPQEASRYIEERTLIGQGDAVAKV